MLLIPRIVTFLILALSPLVCVTVHASDIHFVEDAQYLPVENPEYGALKRILSEEIQVQFKQPGPNGLSFGWVDSPYWIRLHVKQPLPANIDFLEIPWPLLDNIDIYLLDKDKNTLVHQQFGDHLKFSSRPIFDTQFVMPLPASKHSIRYIYLYIDTTSSLQVPIMFWETKDYLKHRSIYLSVQGLFFGVVLAMAIYNLFLYFSTRRIAYLYYVLFVSVFALLQLGLKGLGFQFFWPNMPAINDYSISTGGGFCLLFLTLFARSFLRLEEVKVLSIISGLMLAVSIIFILSSLIVPYHLIIASLALSVILCAILVIAMGAYRYRQGLREARFFLVAWLGMVTGSIFYLMKQLGFLPINILTEHAMQIGWAFEVIMLSLALADRLNSLRARIENTNIELEQTVDQRTKELVTALDELGNANQRLSKISTTDKLTGLRNRHHFDMLLKGEIEASLHQKQTICLLLLDIDHFKRINDEWGHVAGDKALKFVSEQIRQEVKRKVDNLCRYGGEEFAIVLPNTSVEGAACLAEKIRKSLEHKSFTMDTQHLLITLSIGVASSDSVKNKDMDTLIQAADIALYKAKDDGRNCVHIFTGVIDEESIPSLEKSTRHSPPNTHKPSIN